MRIYLMNNQSERVAKRCAACLVDDVVMSEITFAELECGVKVENWINEQGNDTVHN